jgi:hypothetical protein
VHAIKSYNGGVVVISHNREFTSTVCPEEWLVGDGVAKVVGAAYDLTKRREKIELKQQEEITDAFGNTIKVKAPKKKLSRKESKARIKTRAARRERGEDVTATVRVHYSVSRICARRPGSRGLCVLMARLTASLCASAEVLRTAQQPPRLKRTLSCRRRRIYHNKDGPPDGPAHGALRPVHSRCTLRQALGDRHWPCSSREISPLL